MANLRQPVLGMNDTPGGGYTSPMAGGQPPQPQNMSSPMPTGAQFILPGNPDITGQDTAAGGQTNMAMIDQLQALLRQGTPVSALANTQGGG